MSPLSLASGTTTDLGGCPNTSSNAWSVLCGAMHLSIDCICVIIIITIYTLYNASTCLYTFARQNLQTMCGSQWVQGGELELDADSAILELIIRSMYSELVPPGLAIEDVTADHSLAVQLLAKWLERPQSNDSQILSPFSLYRIVGRPN